MNTHHNTHSNLPQTMRAWQLKQYKAPLEFAEIPVPEIHPDEVLVKVRYAGLNHVDKYIQQGQFKALIKYKLPMVAGSEFAGEVVATGANVTIFQIGDPVFGYVDAHRSGAWAEYIPIRAEHIARAPQHVDLAATGGMALTALTAWQALVILGKVGAHDTVLIHGGGGSVGRIAIALAAHRGATVITTASSRDRATLEALGAQHVIDYHTEDFVEVLQRSNIQPTFVLDSQGQDSVLRSIATVAPGAQIIGLVSPPDPDYAASVGANWFMRTALRAMSAKVRRAATKKNAEYHFLFVQPNGADLTKISKLIDQGVIPAHPVTPTTFAEVPQTLDEFAAGKRRGKFVVTM